MEEFTAEQEEAIRTLMRTLGFSREYVLKRSENW